MPGRRRNRLRTRILSWTFIPTAIILSAVAFTIYYAYQRVTEDLVLGRNQQLTHLSASQLASDLHGYADALSALARVPDIYGGDIVLQSNMLRASTNQLLAFDSGAVILSATGKVTATTPQAATLLG